MKYVECTSRSGYAPEGSKRVMHDGKAYLAKRRGDAMLLYACKKTASGASYSGGFCRHIEQAIDNGQAVTLADGTYVTMHMDGKPFERFFPKGTEVLAKLPTSEAGRWALAVRIPGREYVDL